ncbi:hypothetical protein [Paenisporosarcina sp. TG20]|uniref:hypothetical protein n=1 Tax=Paenisporosarcina sp. TG20 TaxID=1211706 RepID=UPI0004746CB7|nr:hypothetical protein [Paenisporosarcina sp. TG20]
MAKKKSKNKNKQKKNTNIVDEYDVFGEFSFIAGYTEGGMPYGVTFDELEEDDQQESGQSNEVKDEDLPF